MLTLTILLTSLHYLSHSSLFRDPVYLNNSWCLFLICLFYWTFLLTCFLIWNTFTDLHVSYLVLYKHKSLIFGVLHLTEVCGEAGLRFFALASTWLYFSKPGCRHLLIINNITFVLKDHDLGSDMNKRNNNKTKIWIEHSPLYLCVFHRNECAWCAYLCSLPSEDVWNLYGKLGKWDFTWGIRRFSTEINSNYATYP